MALIRVVYGQCEAWNEYVVGSSRLLTGCNRFARMKRHILNAPGYKFNNSDLAITTPKGTIISFKSADTPDNLTGEDVYGVVSDEFTRAKQAAWFALRSTVTFTKAPVKFIGNYTGQSNWGHKLTNKAKTDPTEYAAFRVTRLRRGTGWHPGRKGD